PPISGPRVRVANVNGEEFDKAPGGPLPCPGNQSRKFVSHGSGGDDRLNGIHSVSQGLRRITPRPVKSFTFRVRTVRSCSRAVAAIIPSAVFRAAPLNRHSALNTPQRL